MGKPEEPARPKAAQDTPRDDAAQLRLIADNVPAMSIAYDETLHCVFANRRFAEFFGLTTASIVGKHLREIIGEGPYQEVKHAFDEVLTGRRSTYKRTRVLEGGERRHLEVELIPHLAPDGRVRGLFAVTTDVTERKRQEQLRVLGHVVANLIANADSSSAAIRAVIQAICESERWDCGRYFHRPPGAAALQLAEAWSIEDRAIQAFTEGSREIEYAPGAGLVGTAWQSGEPLWVADISKEARALRLAQATDLGLRGAFVFPVKAQGEVIGVLAFNSREHRVPDEPLLQAILSIGSQIGQFLQRKRAEEQLRESEARFRSLCALSSDVFWEQDAEYRFTAVSGSSGRIDPVPALGKTRWEQGFTNMSEADWDAHRAVLQAHLPFRDLELCGKDRLGNPAWYSVSGEPVFDAAGAFAGYRGVGRDITERKLDENRIRELANHDALTGLPNRTCFSALLNAAMQAARRHGQSLSVMFVDLDRFKIINDTLGHHAGDELLQEVAMRLRHTLRASDVVARLGGDEFVVLAEDVKEASQMEAVARKVLAALVKPMFIHGRECTVTASIGICLYPRDASDEQSLMKNADAAMYRAKEAGKNSYRFYSDDSNTSSFERLAMETSLRRAVQREEFFLQYQPRLDLDSGAATGVEALVRWQHPELGMVPPADFIPLAEETGIIVELGAWVLRTACAQAAAWHAQGLPGLRMAVNVSARQFANDDVVKQIAAALASSGLAPPLLEIELTETVVARNVERAAKLLAKIRDLGARLALDDFGTGYSSLSQIKRFPIDTLKVDRSFVAGLPGDGEDAAITRAIIAMGRSLRMVVVAEGVETLEQQAFLQACGCNEMQGFLFSPPLGAAACADFLRQHPPASPA